MWQCNYVFDCWVGHVNQASMLGNGQDPLCRGMGWGCMAPLFENLLGKRLQFIHI